MRNQLGQDLVPEDFVLVDVGSGRGQALQKVRTHTPTLISKVAGCWKTELKHSKITRDVKVECLSHHFSRP